MRILPRLVFWLGVVSIVYGIILKIVMFNTSATEGMPFGLMPDSFLDFSLLCFVGAIAFSVVHIFLKRSD